MNQYCVVVANGARARFFTLESSQFPELESGPNLVELTALSNPQHDASGADLWSEPKSGRNRGGIGGAAHGYDDHRTQHEEEYDRRFANDIAQECCRLTQEHGASDVVLVSEKRMLGHLRAAMEPRLNGVRTVELAKDLSKLSPTQLQEHLAREDLLPPRRNPAA